MTDKSITSSRGLETAIFDVFNDALAYRFRKVMGYDMPTIDFSVNNAPASGVNPTHSLERQV